MDRFPEALTFLLRDDIEGGLVDDPKDPGGLTNCGISLAAHPELGAETIRKLKKTDPLVGDLYRREYWVPARCGDVPYKVGLVLFDASVQHGVRGNLAKGDRGAVDLLQEAAGATVDGDFGPKTLQRVMARPASDLAARFLRVRLTYYQGLSNWPHAKNGWMERLFKVAMAVGAA